MRSSSEPAPRRSAEAALLEKIEELSFLRLLNDRLARVPDFASACRALVDLVWEERRADAVAYVSVDAQRRLCRVEATAPATAGDVMAEFGFDTPPFSALLDRPEPIALAGTPAPSWLGGGRGQGLTGGVLISAPTQVRGTTTGLLLVYIRGDAATLEEDQRLLAIITTSAALALDAARGEAREEFLATLRHDINNPVAVALGYTEMIVERLRAAGDEQSTTLAASVAELLKVIADLVSNYLHMAAIDRGVPWLHYEEIDLGALAAEIVEQLAASAAEKGITIACHGSCPSARADRRQLGRVITNLVRNAVKYTPGPGRVDVTTASDVTGARLVVADTGYGLTATDLRRLFTKYARFHRHNGIPGTGLGLYISKAIVEAHGGTLTAASEAGRGSLFTLTLPLRPA
ncbi:MAG TPA: HAMP domain-containing sensor histidine kinase [Candidatus Binatus sp.]|nr:HAMP domain-containing sensor histidine kinase [Candidatus Binatus sp.]